MKISEYIRRKVFDNERGAAMLAVMVTLVALTVIGIAATRTSTFESASSGNQKRKQAAFYAAEAGLEHGRAVLGNDVSKWSSVLEDAEGKSYKDGASLLSDVSFFDGKYTYTVKVWNNKEDAEVDRDTDSTIIMRSQAVSKNNKDGEFAAVEISLGAGVGDDDSRFTQEQTAQDGAGTGKNYNANDKNAVDVTADDGSTNFQL
ncbi:MAG: PilX N-terminal domain-containing pilus assembly protein [Desulfococcaceae bacterium]